MIKYQDLHLADNTLNQQFKTAMENGEYNNAFAVLQQAQLTDKMMIASVFNFVSSRIVETENTQDVTFKNDVIKVSAIPPVGMTSGEVYFKLKE